MEKIEYKVEKDKEFIGQRYETYTIEKKITHINGDVEIRTKVFIPFRDGDINTVKLDDLYFPITITQEEMKQLPEEYDKAWMRGTLTKEMSKKMQELVLLMRANKKMAGGVA
mgnify:CR=1 FL=1|jgi:hypothetical protein